MFDFLLNLFSLSGLVLYRASKHPCLQKTEPWKGWSPFRRVLLTLSEGCACSSTLTSFWAQSVFQQISKRQFRCMMWTWKLVVWDKSKPGLTVLSKRDKRVSQPAAKKAFNLARSAGLRPVAHRAVLTSPFQTSCRHKPPQLANRWSASARSWPAGWSKQREKPVC